MLKRQQYGAYSTAINFIDIHIFIVTPLTLNSHVKGLQKCFKKEVCTVIKTDNCIVGKKTCHVTKSEAKAWYRKSSNNTINSHDHNDLPLHWMPLVNRFHTVDYELFFRISTRHSEAEINKIYVNSYVCPKTDQLNDFTMIRTKR